MKTARLVVPGGRKIDDEDAVPGRRCLLLSAPHAVCLSRNGRRRRRDRPGGDQGQFLATGLPENTPIQTYWGDARQFVELHQDTKKYDLVFGDAFNDFSVPWHLTTREFNEKIKKMLTPNGVYMINIIDVYESDADAEKKADKKIEDDDVTDAGRKGRISRDERHGGGASLWRLPRCLDQDRQAHISIMFISSGPTTPGKGPSRDVRGRRLECSRST